MINEEVVDSLPFITGMGYRKKCDFIYDDYEKVDVTKIDQFENIMNKLEASMKTTS